MPFTSYFQKQLLTYGCGAVTSPAVAATHWIGLSSTQPTQYPGSSSFWNITELSGNGYARESLTNNTTNWAVTTNEPGTSSDAGGYQVQNGVAVTFPTSTGSWNSGNPIPWFFVADGSGALNPGTVNVLFYGTLVPNLTVAATGVTPNFAIGTLIVTLN